MVILHVKRDDQSLFLTDANKVSDTVANVYTHVVTQDWLQRQQAPTEASPIEEVKEASDTRQVDSDDEEEDIRPVKKKKEQPPIKEADKDAIASALNEATTYISPNQVTHGQGIDLENVQRRDRALRELMAPLVEKDENEPLHAFLQDHPQALACIPGLLADEEIALWWANKELKKVKEVSETNKLVTSFATMQLQMQQRNKEQVKIIEGGESDEEETAPKEEKENEPPLALLSDYIGRNDKTKIILKLTKKGTGAPMREVPIDEKMQKQMMSYYYQKQEEHKKLMSAPNDDPFRQASWADSQHLKRSFTGLGDVKFR